MKENRKYIPISTAMRYHIEIFLDFSGTIENRYHEKIREYSFCQFIIIVKYSPVLLFNINKKRWKHVWSDKVLK